MNDIASDDKLKGMLDKGAGCLSCTNISITDISIIAIDVRI